MPSGPNLCYVGVSQNLRVLLLGVPMIRTIVYWGPYWGSPILGKCHVACRDLEWGSTQGGSSLGFKVEG